MLLLYSEMSKSTREWGEVGEKTTKERDFVRSLQAGARTLSSRGLGFSRERLGLNAEKAAQCVRCALHTFTRWAGWGRSNNVFAKTDHGVIGFGEVRA